MQSNRDQYGWNPDAWESWLVGLFWDAWDQVSGLLGTLALGTLALLCILVALVLVYLVATAGYRKINRNFRAKLICPECDREMKKLQNPWGPLVLTCDHGVDDPYAESPLMSRGDAIAAQMKKGGRS